MRSLTRGFRGFALIVVTLAMLCPCFLSHARSETESQAVSASPASTKVLRLDMGTADSPVAQGFRGVTAAPYSPDVGFGWVGTGYESVKTVPPTRPQSPWVMQESDYYASMVNDLNVDHVKNPGDMTFRVDVPDGTYRAILYVGDLRYALGSMRIYANGELVRKNVQSKQWIGRGGGPSAYGNSFPVRFNISARGGFIEIGIKGDDSDYRAWLDRDSKLPPTESFLAGKGGSKYNRDLEAYQKGEPLEARSDLGHPFVHNSIQALEVYPLSEPPFTSTDCALKTAPSASSDLALAVQLFNDKRFAEAIEAFDGLPDLRARVLGLLSVLGSPDYDVRDGDASLVSKLTPLISEAADAYPDDHLIAEGEITFDLFREALRRITERGRTGNGYHMCTTAGAMLEKVQPDDPLYYKALIYRARAYYMVDPHRWGQPSGTAKKLLEEVEKAFPQNRFVRLYLYQEWEENYEWSLKDYLEDAGDAPEWAAALRDANNLLLDLSEWWIINKQQPDGQIGGGWGDDVELVGLFGFYASISKHISDIAHAGATKLVNGAWLYSEIDTEAGFFEGTADAEHSSEFTGDTLPMMMIIDYGNPIWIERTLKTGKLIRDLWTAKNDNGYRSFRSNYIGAVMVGSGKQAANSSICLRAIQPVFTVYDYNHNPQLEKLLVELADGWVDASMQTGKGKPRGIIPTTVSFPGVEMGGPGAPAWFDTGEVPWRQFFVWPQYRGYQVDLLLWAYKATGDEKYLEPFSLAADYLASHEPDPDAPKGSPAWIAANLTEHSGIHFLQSMQEKKTINVAEATGDRSVVIEQSRKVHDKLRPNWPLKTTDSLATDRVAFSGIVNPYFTLTGGGLAGGRATVGGIKPAVTYENTGRDFAAYVPVVDPAALKVVIYLFHDEPRKIGFCPWALEVGGTYGLRAGPDADGDDRIDEVTDRKSFTLQSRAEPVYLDVPGRQTYVVEIEQTKPGVGVKVLLPDLAVHSGDLEFNAQRGMLIARVHNVGALPVEDSLLRFYDGDPNDGGVAIGSAMIPYVLPPNDFDPKTVRLGISWKPSRPEHEIYVALDPDGELSEISEANNVAHTRMTFDLQADSRGTPEETGGGRGR